MFFVHELFQFVARRRISTAIEKAAGIGALRLAGF
jgi:hypothetical protein